MREQWQRKEIFLSEKGRIHLRSFCNRVTSKESGASEHEGDITKTESGMREKPSVWGKGLNNY